MTDASTGEPLPYVVIQFKGTDLGAQTDFEGKYIIKSTIYRDSLSAIYVGYRTKTRHLDKQKSQQTINFQLQEDTKLLGEVVIKRGENPAWEILRRVQKYKPINDKRSLKAYEYESYSKVQVDIDNVSQKMRKRKLIKKVIAAIDSIKKVTNDEGKPVIPIYLSETISRIYYTNEPFRQKEHIIAQNVSGILDESNAQFIAQATGSSVYDFNFYQNWMKFMGRDFVSPIAESWKDYYDYDLEDSLYLDTSFCYKINVKPKREADLAFKGTVWITKNEYAIKRSDLTIGRSANINFIEKIKIQQEMAKTEVGAWLPQKMRFNIDLAEPTDSSAGFLIKYYISNKSAETNKPRSENFFNMGLETEEDAKDHDSDYWLSHRHDSLSATDKKVFEMIDTIRNISIVKSYIEVIDLAVNGYKKFNFFEIGPYPQSFAWNNIEGFRGKLGLRSSYKFSKKLLLRGYLAYGTTDEKFKYGASVDYMFLKKKWLWAGLEYFYDLEQMAILANRSQISPLFYAISRWGNLDNANPFYIQNASAYSQIDIVRGVSQKVQLNYQIFNQVPIDYEKYNFGYYSVPGDTNSQIFNSLTNSDITFETRIARRETFMYYEHNRLGLGNEQFPVVTLRYQLGIKGVGGSQFSYHKFGIRIFHNITVGKFGRSEYTVRGNYIPQTLPYPLLNIHLGNQSFIFSPAAFSLLNFFEFVSSRSVSLNYQHHFNGFFFNRVPLFYKLKLRETISFNAIWGMATDSDLNMTPRNTETKYRSFNALDPNIPYAEVGVGIENIFKIIRIDFFKRLTYLDTDYEIQNWGVKIGFNFSL